MRETSRRPRRLAARRLMLPRPDATPDTGVLPIAGSLFGLLRPLRVVRRGGGVVLWTLLCMPVQAMCLMLPGRAKVVFAQFYWSSVCRLLGLRVRMIGAVAGSTNGRPVVFVSNHSSWLDIPVLGGRLNACFISKDEVGRWPFVSTIARLGRTVFISRQRHATGRERDALRDRLAAGDNLLLFPEGTTSDGSRVLPFRSSFFAIAEGPDPPLIQPVSVVYDRLGGLPTGRASRPVFAWYGDMDLASHFWRLAQQRGLRASILLHPPLDPTRFASRKALSHAVWQAVADGASTLRQNRPVEVAVAADLTAEPAYA
ncbi:MAG TPA: lysophospholipid acyltransferase family protein [Acetobacteraceae bacterium]|nr:lysophospholipid acyltransferase family protein [Acetobacteraceae bacterium]